MEQKLDDEELEGLWLEERGNESAPLIDSRGNKKAVRTGIMEDMDAVIEELMSRGQKISEDDEELMQGVGYLGKGCSNTLVDLESRTLLEEDWRRELGFRRRKMNRVGLCDEDDVNYEEYLQSEGWWGMPKYLEDLALWKSPAISAMIFVVSTGILLAISYFSAIIVFSYFSLLLLGGSFIYRGYTIVDNALSNREDDEDPLRHLMWSKITELTDDQILEVSKRTVGYVNSMLIGLRDLLMIESILDSIKFAAILYIVSLIGARITLLTFMTVMILSFFTLPLLLNAYSPQIKNRMGRFGTTVAGMTANLLNVRRQEIQQNSYETIASVRRVSADDGNNQ